MLSTTSTYAVRALACLARAAPGAALRGRDLARRAAVPPHYLAKLLLDLKRAGIVDATRGAGGGYRLARAPEEIRLGEVVALFDGPLEADHCLLGDGRRCDPARPCALHDDWSDLTGHFRGFLATTTLEQLAGDGAGDGAG